MMHSQSVQQFASNNTPRYMMHSASCSTVHTGKNGVLFDDKEIAHGVLNSCFSTLNCAVFKCLTHLCVLFLFQCAKINNIHSHIKHTSVLKLIIIMNLIIISLNGWGRRQSIL